jgi:hypothetical protein
LVERILDKGYQVDEKTIKYWEKDALYPDITMIYILAEILELSPNDLLLAKQYMYEAGLNAVDMMTMRVVCNLIDVSIWKIHQFWSVFKWILLVGCAGAALVNIWWHIRLICKTELMVKLSKNYCFFYRKHLK